jgi:prepilin-type N-terminal cleavage/methylation domain-containing protein
MTTKESKAKGFTLMELLIVIAILAILSVALVLMLNPAETLRKGRDSQRMSDLATMKTAIGLYMTTVSTPILDGGTNTLCVGGSGSATIFYSGAVTAGSVVAATNFIAGNTSGTGIAGNGWLPVDFTKISGGSPISNLPIDPLNTVVTAGAPTSGDKMYRYSCKSDATFEINTVLESDELKGNMGTDGGNNLDYYEVGSSLTILPNGTDF